MEKKSTNSKTTKKRTNSKKKTSSKAATNKKTVSAIKNASSVKKVESKKLETKEIVTKLDNKETIKNNESKKIEMKNIRAMNDYQDDTDFGGDEIRKLLIIIGAVCAIMLVFYFITEGVVKHKNGKPKEETPEIKIEPDIQYDNILMGALLNQKEDSYYVLAYTDDDEFYQIYEAYLDKYNELDDHLKVYKVNLSDGFNKSYIAETSYLEGSNINSIKVTGTTLIRIEEGEIYLSFEGVDAIIGRLKYITE